MLGQRLKEQRIRRNLRQEDVALKIGIARTTYAMYEQNKREPDNETLQKLADFFNVKIDYLLGRQEENYDYTKDPTVTGEIKELLDDLMQLPPEERTIIINQARIFTEGLKAKNRSTNK
ncbi:helix-turn-helix domain-containing protein [Brevibacillus sp. 7WMA2]|uniref:helix-turn-helix domain-containing protein n=1 Tax=Brevibacillus sp. 7WMA2 TaxID=2683193 RepID=UPI0013A74B72|nr:helix-turn-helix domain-containing protein [Brevibacillus sp. 7WMA2]QIC07647.1 helix-turn-helix domain-containing protein [Brevibacillus sp. 7WMA2]